VTWVLVVAAVVALAIAVHFYEKAQGRARAARKQARLEQEGREPHLLSLTREIREKWDVDLEAMMLRLTRAELGSATPQPIIYRLERTTTGDWLMRQDAAHSELQATEQLPPHVAQLLEARYQRFLSSRSERA